MAAWERLLYLQFLSHFYCTFISLSSYFNRSLGLLWYSTTNALLWNLITLLSHFYFTFMNSLCICISSIPLCPLFFHFNHSLALLWYCTYITLLSHVYHIISMHFYHTSITFLSDYFTHFYHILFQFYPIIVIPCLWHFYLTFIKLQSLSRTSMVLLMLFFPTFISFPLHFYPIFIPLLLQCMHLHHSLALLWYPYPTSFQIYFTALLYTLLSHLYPTSISSTFLLTFHQDCNLGSLDNSSWAVSGLLENVSRKLGPFPNLWF